MGRVRTVLVALVVIASGGMLYALRVEAGHALLGAGLAALFVIYGAVQAAEAARRRRYGLVVQRLTSCLAIAWVLLWTGDGILALLPLSVHVVIPVALLSLAFVARALDRRDQRVKEREAEAAPRVFE